MAATTPLTKFLPYVSQYVIGCPDPFTIQMLRSVCIDFCQATTLVQYVNTQDVTATVQDYAVTIPANMNIVKVMDVFYGDTPLVPSPIEMVNSGLAMRGNVNGATQSAGTPQTYFLKTPHSTSVSLYPVPDTTVSTGLAIRTCFSPNRTATIVEDSLFDNWAEEITAGTVARLMMVPNQPFSNMAEAATYMQRYNAAVRDASIYARVGQTVGSSRVRPVAFV